jgi:hypothetical protein
LPIVKSMTALAAGLFLEQCECRVEVVRSDRFDDLLQLLALGSGERRFDVRRGEVALREAALERGVVPQLECVGVHVHARHARCARGLLRRRRLGEEQCLGRAHFRSTHDGVVDARRGATNERGESEHDRESNVRHGFNSSGT